MIHTLITLSFHSLRIPDFPEEKKKRENKNLILLDSSSVFSSLKFCFDSDGAITMENTIEEHRKF